MVQIGEKTWLPVGGAFFSDFSLKGIPDAIAKEITCLVETAKIAKDDIDDYFCVTVKNMWEMCSHGQCVQFFK
ncbi:hypothetical protein DPMN_024245, partial [Dreissena polymorpha]